MFNKLTTEKVHMKEK